MRLNGRSVRGFSLGADDTDVDTLVAAKLVDGQSVSDRRVVSRFLRARSPMIELSKAVHAQDKLGSRIGGRPWLQGIAVLADASGSHYLRVNVQTMTDEVTKTVPAEMEGVPVVVQASGKLRPL